jgi:hypothetical protein
MSDERTRTERWPPLFEADAGSGMSAGALLDRDAGIRNGAIALTHDRSLGGEGCRRKLDGTPSLDRA